MSTLKQALCLAGMIVMHPMPSQAADSGIEALVQAAIDRGESTQSRIAAVKSLGQEGDPRAIEPLILVYRNLSDEDPLLETTVRRTLEELAAVDYLQVKLQDPDPAVREGAAMMLGVLGDPDGADPLLAALGDPAPKVREASATALAKLGLARSAAGLSAVLNGDEVADVRMAAAQALGRVGTPEARAALEQAAKTESDDFVRVMIRMSLSAEARDLRPE